MKRITQYWPVALLLLWVAVPITLIFTLPVQGDHKVKNEINVDTITCKELVVRGPHGASVTIRGNGRDMGVWVKNPEKHPGAVALFVNGVGPAIGVYGDPSKNSNMCGIGAFENGEGHLQLFDSKGHIKIFDASRSKHAFVVVPHEQDKK